MASVFDCAKILRLAVCRLFDQTVSDLSGILTNLVGRVYNACEVILPRPLARQDSPDDASPDNFIDADVCTGYQNRALCAAQTLTAGAWMTGLDTARRLSLRRGKS